MFRFSRAFAWSTLIALSASAHAVDTQTSRLAAAFDAHYNNVRTLRADFVENYSGAGLSRKESGTLTLKKPGKMRWDYHEPRAKVFLSDGKNAYFYVPGERQASRAPVKKLEDLRSPLRYLLGHSNLQKELNGLHVDGSAQPSTPGNIVLSGVPKGMEERVSHVRLELTPVGLLVGISIEELDGSRTEFVFRNMAENEEFPNSNFRFVPPPGVEVMDAPELNQ